MKESIEGMSYIQIAGEFGFSVPYGMLTSLTA